MPQLGRIRQPFTDATGVPIVGLSVTVRKQGSTVNGLHSGAQTSFLVNDPGGITSSPQDQLQVGTDATVTRSVSSVAATNVTVGATGFTDVADDARLTPTTNLPTLYNDAQGDETLANPMTTDANGEVVCWVPITPYDLHVSGSGYTTRLIQDVVPEGHERLVSNVYPGAASIAFQKDTSRAMVSGSKLERWLSGATEKFSIGLNAALGAVLPAHNVAGLLTIDSGGLTITAGDLTFGAAASRVIPGATSLALRNNANSADNILVSDAGAVTIRAGLTVTSGGAAITGNSTITGTLVGLTGLTVASGGASITGSSTIGGVTLDPSGPILGTANLEINKISSGQKITFRTLSELLTINAAATTDSAITLNTNAIILAVSVRVTVTIPTAATFTVTGTSSGTTFSTAAVSTASGSTDVGTASCPYKNGAGQLVRITPNLTPATNAGRVRVTIHYFDVTPATS